MTAGVPIEAEIGHILGRHNSTGSYKNDFQVHNNQGALNCCTFNDSKYQYANLKKS